MQLKRSSSSSTPISVKLKTMFLNLITHSLYSLLRSLSRAKSILIEISKHNKKRLFMMMFYLKTSSIHQRKVFFGSSSSHVVHVTTSFSISLHADEDEDGHESEYFEWLEEEVDESNNINDDHSVGDVDIDRLADMFIASCHEKFLLEKVESYRRYQDMLERSL
ncbi:uncharacterized protein LOC103866613 [Brassica rapa]|uniref:Cotton fiber protein n=1 Tax=Brassica campestris TaxID=3711 RepID=M4CKD7_BRACM|nr:uncharacterized protein LOC103866613 [Brassica rapa]